jgi:hypothetical protein
MAELSRQPDTLPDNPYEHKVCGVTLFCSALFLAAGVYYLLGPSKSELAYTLVMITGGIFLLAMVNFFAAAFRGKLCGCKKE